jgi:uncharacterized membrane protein YhiD involved in acid resistance
MTTIKNIMVMGIVLLFSGVQLQAADYAAPFLDKGTQPRAAGLGNGYTALANGSDAVYWNPAGLASQASGYDAGVMGFKAFETTYLSVQGSIPLQTMLGKVVVGAAMVSSRLDGISTTQLNTSLPGITDRYQLGSQVSYSGTGYFLGAGMAVNKELAIGTTLKMIQENAAQYGASGMGLDVGVTYKIAPAITLAGTIINLIQPNMTWNTPSKSVDTMARVFKVGAGIECIPNTCRLSTDLVYRRNQVYVQGGVEYVLNALMTLRVGGNTDEFSVGTGLYLTNNIQLDFAWTRPSQWEVEDSYKFAIAVRE